jgi:hypothetical protein
MKAGEAPIIRNKDTSPYRSGSMPELNLELQDRDPSVNSAIKLSRHIENILFSAGFNGISDHTTTPFHILSACKIISMTIF